MGRPNTIPVLRRWSLVAARRLAQTAGETTGAAVWRPSSRT